MNGPSMKRASLAELRARKDRGELANRADAVEGESLGADFWKKAKVKAPATKRSVHLKLDPDVFQFFYEQADGKGHLTQMQAVLRAYAEAHRR
ncbi:MAG: hypothetical protein CMH13_21765 [Martelella sp.]|uniref:BrnA antitoxin family protein n=2 Tax=unclassified Martelella TaxID=2629616 RepID=UPI000C46FBF8|nr:hypothetical protein [Martelella sp.]